MSPDTELSQIQKTSWTCEHMNYQWWVSSRQNQREQMVLKCY